MYLFSVEYLLNYKSAFLILFAKRIKISNTSHAEQEEASNTTIS